MPSSGFFFGASGQGASLIDFLPSRLAADLLIKQYFEYVHPICQIVHRPTFEKEYDTFWDEVSLGIEPPVSVQTIVFAALFSAVISMDEAVINRDFGVSATFHCQFSTLKFEFNIASSKTNRGILQRYLRANKSIK
jgi:hypothetical protein